MIKADVKFEKWRDPFFDDNSDWPKHSNENEELLNSADIDNSELDDDLGGDGEIELHGRPTPFLKTSMGPLSLTEYTQPCKVFNFWVGHTNVNLTRKICETIEKVDGVEILTVFTRYRFRVGVGKMFKDGTVVRDIRKAILNEVRLSNENRFPVL